MGNPMERRDMLKLLGVGGVVYASSLLQGLSGCASAGSGVHADGLAPGAPSPSPGPRAARDFFFVQISDTHWGFSGPDINPNADVELKRAVAAIHALSAKPDFVVFTGDLTHTTTDDDQRRQRMREFKEIVADLAVPFVKFMPGEHDAALDAGAAYREFFGDLHYSFDHKGIHFVALDNVSDADAKLGDAQLSWLRADLSRVDRTAPIVVFTHRPLWDLRPDWEWRTSDGSAALDILMPYQNVTVFFGHIHQELHHTTGHIAHHAARSLVFALPAPDAPGKRAPIPWDANKPEQGIGYRNVAARPAQPSYELTEVAISAAPTR